MSKMKDSMLDIENKKITKEELRKRFDERKHKFNFTNPFDSREREQLDMQYAYGNGRY